MDWQWPQGCSGVSFSGHPRAAAATRSAAYQGADIAFPDPRVRQFRSLRTFRGRHQSFDDAGGRTYSLAPRTLRHERKSTRSDERRSGRRKNALRFVWCECRLVGDHDYRDESQYDDEAAGLGSAMGHASHESHPRASHRAAGASNDARTPTHRAPGSGPSVQRSAHARSSRHPRARGGALWLTRVPASAPGRSQRRCHTAHAGISAPKIRSTAQACGVSPLVASVIEVKSQFRWLNIAAEEITGPTLPRFKTEAVDYGIVDRLNGKPSDARPGEDLSVMIACENSVPSSTPTTVTMGSHALRNAWFRMRVNG